MMVDVTSDPMGDTSAQLIADSGDGNASPSPMSVDYYRQQVAKFQALLNNLDPVYYDLQSAVASFEIMDDADAQAAYQEGMNLLGEFESKRADILAAAQAVNLASNGMNAIGVPFPRLQYQGLNVGPIVAVAAAAGVAYVLVQWGITFINRVSDWAQRAQTLTAVRQLPADQQQTILAQLAQTDADAQRAAAATSGSVLSQASSLVKWIVVGAGVWFGWKLYQESKA